MKILAIEFSSDHRSVAVLDGERLLAAQTVTEGRDTAAVQLIESALGQAEVGRSEIECIAVGIGPGSYTGIRAAIALTQGWQLALGVKVQAVDSLEALATGEQAAGRRGEITLAVDAQRGEFYLARFELADDGIRNVEPTRSGQAAGIRVVARRRPTRHRPRLGRQISRRRACRPPGRGPQRFRRGLGA